MTNRKKIAALKKVQSCYEDISNLLKEIIENTFDYHCDMIFNFNIGDDSVFVYYEYRCRGEYGRDEVEIPIAWLDEGFDYKEAYKEMRRQEALAAIRKEEEEKKRRKKLREAKAKIRKEREYKKYLALKKKYESEDK